MNRDILRLGGMFSILTALTYPLIAGAYFSAPGEIFGGGDEGFTAVLEHRAIFSLLWGGQALAAALGIGVVTAMAEISNGSHAG